MNKNQAEQKLREVIRRKHFSLSTEQTYAAWLCRFMRYVEKLPAGLSSEMKIERFLTAAMAPHFNDLANWLREEPGDKS